MSIASISVSSTSHSDIREYHARAVYQVSFSVSENIDPITADSFGMGGGEGLLPAAYSVFGLAPNV